MLKLVVKFNKKVENKSQYNFITKELYEAKTQPRPSFSYLMVFETRL